ncbi:hypothetical protein B0H14DRAFT_2574721 [Mycena olivaceomarginata]|nr:hypothetical protein B0H14DRAFT_2574721 [Mycena olivaceomarginata]
MSLSLLLLSSTQDKALKKEALRCIEDSHRPVPGELHIWLDYHGASAPAIRDRQSHESVRATIVARVTARAAAKKARKDCVAHLENLRKRAIEASARKWPRARCHPQHPENQLYRLKQRREEEARIQKEKEREHAENRAAAAARVAHLEALRSVLRIHLTCADPRTILCDYSRVFKRLSIGSFSQSGNAPQPHGHSHLTTMACGGFCLMPPLSFSIYVEVALFCGVATRLSLLRLTKSLNVILRHLLYRNITVQGTSARKLVHSLANNPLLPPIVETLLFEDVSTHVNLEEWTRVLPQLVNLWCLGIAPNIPLPQQAIPRITFRLTCFQAICSVAGAWRDFIASQSILDEIYLNSFFWGDVPGPQQLPHLRSLKGHPQDLVNFAAVHSLVDIWVFTGVPLHTHVFSPSDLEKLAASPSRLFTIRISALDFLAVLEAAPALLMMLRHLVIDEDLSWSNFTLATGDDLSRSTFGRLAASPGRPFFALENGPPRLARRLRAFRFYASDGCAFWYNWGQDTGGSVVCYTSDGATPGFKVAHQYRKLGPDGSTVSEVLIASWVPTAARMFRRLPTNTTNSVRIILMDPSILRMFSKTKERRSPPVADPTEHRRQRLRSEPCAQNSAEATNSSHKPMTDVQWNKWINELMAAAEAPDQQVGEEDETHTEKGEQEEEERKRAWDRAIMLCVEGMRESDRREWFWDQRMQEEREARYAKTADSASSVVVASDLKHGERCVQLDLFPYLVSLHWSGLGQIHGELAESYWGFTGLGRTEAELPLNTWYIPYLYLALGIFYMTGDDEDDDEMPPLIEEEEIPDVRYCGGGVRSKL